MKVKEQKLILSYAFLRGIILTLFTGFLPLYLFVVLKIPVYVFILILTSYTLMGVFSSKKLSNFKQGLLISIITLLISLLLFSTNNLFVIIFATLLLGLSSGLIRPYVVAELRGYKQVQVDLEIAERLYAILNIAILLIGGFLFWKYDFQYVVLLTLVVYIIYIILQFVQKENTK